MGWWGGVGWWVCGPWDFSVSPRHLFGFLGFGAKGLGPGLDNNLFKSYFFTELCDWCSQGGNSQYHADVQDTKTARIVLSTNSILLRYIILTIPQVTGSIGVLTTQQRTEGISKLAMINIFRFDISSSLLLSVVLWYCKIQFFLPICMDYYDLQIQSRVHIQSLKILRKEIMIVLSASGSFKLWFWILKFWNDDNKNKTKFVKSSIVALLQSSFLG